MILRKLEVLPGFIIGGHNLNNMIRRGHCVDGRKKTVKLLDSKRKKGLSIVRRKNVWPLARDTVQEAGNKLEIWKNQAIKEI